MASGRTGDLFSFAHLFCFDQETKNKKTKVAPGTILARHEAAGHRHRVVDRALAVLELADMKTDHNRKEEAAVLYKKGLECLAAALATLKQAVGEGEENTDALIDRVKERNRNCL